MYGRTGVDHHNSRKVYVYSPDNILLYTFDSQTQAIKALGISRTSFYRYLDSGKVFYASKGNYIFTSSLS